MNGRRYPASGTATVVWLGGVVRHALEVGHAATSTGSVRPMHAPSGSGRGRKRYDKKGTTSGLMAKSERGPSLLILHRARSSINRATFRRLQILQMVANVCHTTPKRHLLPRYAHHIYIEIREAAIKHAANTFLHVNTFSHV
jgi:hypothetical protein